MSRPGAPPRAWSPATWASTTSLHASGCARSAARRGYPSDAWFFQIAYPQTGFLFDRADEQGVSWVNLGEGVAHLAPLPDRDRNTAEQQGVARRYAKSDLGALTPGGCYDPFIGT